MGHNLNPPKCRRCSDALKPIVFYTYHTETEATILGFMLCPTHGVFWLFHEDGSWTMPPAQFLSNFKMPYPDRARLLSPAEVLKEKWIRE